MRPLVVISMIVAALVLLFEVKYKAREVSLLNKKLNEEIDMIEAQNTVMEAEVAYLFSVKRVERLYKASELSRNLSLPLSKQIMSMKIEDEINE